MIPTDAASLDWSEDDTTNEYGHTVWRGQFPCGGNFTYSEGLNFHALHYVSIPSVSYSYAAEVEPVVVRVELLMLSVLKDPSQDLLFKAITFGNSKTLRDVLYRFPDRVSAGSVQTCVYLTRRFV